MSTGWLKILSRSIYKQKIQLYLSKENKVVPSCSLRNVDNKERLIKKHLVLVDIKCSNVTSVSANCHSSDSHLIFRCKRGYRFSNNQGMNAF